MYDELSMKKEGLTPRCSFQRYHTACKKKPVLSPLAFARSKIAQNKSQTRTIMAAAMVINEPAEDNAIVPHDPPSSVNNSVDVMSMSLPQEGVEKMMDQDNDNNNSPPTTSLDDELVEIIPSPKKKKKKRLILDYECDDTLAPPPLFTDGEDDSTSVAVMATEPMSDHGGRNNDDVVTEQKIIHEAKRAKMFDDDDDSMKKMGKDLYDKLDYLHEVSSGV